MMPTSERDPVIATEGLVSYPKFSGGTLICDSCSPKLLELILF